MESKENIDSGWAWVVLGASAFNMMMLGAMSISIGMFQAEFLKQFEGSTARISVACSMCISFQMLLAPLASTLCNVGGIRLPMMLGAALLSLGLLLASFVSDLTQLLLAYGVVAGIGFGMLYTPSAISIGHYFKKKRVLANGIVLSASGIGMMSGPHLIGWLIDRYGWRFALTVFSCIIAQMNVSGALMFPLKETCRLPSQENISGDERRIDKKSLLQRFRKQLCGNSQMTPCSNLAVFRKKTLWILGIHYFLEMAGYSIQVVHFPSYVQSVGVSHTKVPVLFTAYGISVTLARVLGGIIGSNIRADLITMYIITQGFMSVFIMLMPLVAYGFIELIIYEILLALSYGSSYVLLTPIIVQLFGVENLATVIGLLFFLGGVSFLVVPTIAGALYDVTSSYSMGFHIGGLTVFMGSLVLILIPVLAKRNKRRVILEKERTDLLLVEKMSSDSQKNSQTHEAQC